MIQRSSCPQDIPDVDVVDLMDNKRLEAQLLVLDEQIRKFSRIRDRLSTSGKDADSYYRKVTAEREEVSKILKPLSEEELGIESPTQHPEQVLIKQQIEPARFIRELGIFGFGTAGFVQMGIASEGVNIVAHGERPSSGEITSVPGAYPGSVLYKGSPRVGPESITPSEYDPSVDYFWLHSWKTLIPFPRPSTDSKFTYQFDVSAQTFVFGGNDVTVMVFVSVGETNNLTTGSDVVANIDAGWPIVADLNEPADHYNGHYGSVEGNSTFQRTFFVPKDSVPAVAIVVGAVVSMPMMSRVSLTFGQHSRISVGTQNMTGRISFSYEPQLVAQR